MSEEERRDRRTEHHKPCPKCGKEICWWKHPTDAVNPIGLWHHETPEDDDNCTIGY
jgi:hypothetical protein